ncbi:MAG: hypothetical protein V4607_12215 [Pseudomonadota bacterium]
MLKKILLVGTSVLLAFAANTATAGGVQTPPYTVVPVTGSIKVIGTEYNEQNGSSKIFKDTGDAEALIDHALGRDPDMKYADAKNYVLGLARYGVNPCSSELVVWDKRNNGSVAAEIAYLYSCEDDSVYSEPASSKNGSVSEYSTTNIYFLGEGSTCGAKDTSSLSGEAFGLSLITGKVTRGEDDEDYEDDVFTASAASTTGIIGNLYTDEDDHVIITGGSFKANLAPTKKLGTSTTPIALTCEN